MKSIARLAELLLLWLLPVSWLVACFDLFRQWEPSPKYSNSIVFLFLAMIWLFGLKGLRTGLPALRAKLWGGAALLCFLSLVIGLVVFRLYPMNWAFWFVFFPGLLVAANTLPGKSDASGETEG